jgi:hypothetical protein
MEIRRIARHLLRTGGNRSRKSVLEEMTLCFQRSRLSLGKRVSSRHQSPRERFVRIGLKFLTSSRKLLSKMPEFSHSAQAIQISVCLGKMQKIG